MTRSKTKTPHHEPNRQHPAYQDEDSVSSEEVTAQTQQRQACEQGTKTAEKRTTR